MKSAIFAYSRQGCKTARQIMNVISPVECRAYAPERLSETGFLPLLGGSAQFYGDLFHWADTLVFVGACGIAVRVIAPYIDNKCSDPAVLCVDEYAKYVIPVLSGHIGGANKLAARLAESLGSIAVITTATDIANRFSIDEWAAENGYSMDNMETAKQVSAAILEHDVYLNSDFTVATPLPDGLVYGNSGLIGICITYKKYTPFSKTLRVIPPVLHLGIGCRKGTKAEAICQIVDDIFAEYGLDKRAVRYVATIDLKAQEQGFLDYCKDNDWECRFYPASELRKVQGYFSSSGFVEQITGVDNVCERAAMKDAAFLIVPKTARNGVTVAVAAESMEVYFG